MFESVSYLDQRAITWHPKRVDLDLVEKGVQRASQFPRGFRDDLVDIDRLAKAICSCAWSPVIWRDGKRLTENFIASCFMVLDFDEADYTIEQAKADWADSVHIIATTKSHQREKGGKPPKDRFRVVSPWDDCIFDPDVYSHNVAVLVKKYDADPTCIDAARFFWPCREIMSIQRDGYLQPVLPFTKPEVLPVDEQRRRSLRKELFGNGLPIWVAEFVNKGKLPKFEVNGSRKWACNAVARRLRNLGWNAAEVANLLHDGKFDRTDFDSSEIDAAVKSAFKSKKGRQ